MDPTDVLRVLWRQRRYVGPALLVALLAAAYVFQLAPRTYESTATYALVNPALPSGAELDANPELAALNGDNPYLRSADSNLVTDALLARLGAGSTVERLRADGVGTEFGAGPGAGGNGFVVDITGVGPTPEASIATTTAVGAVLEQELRTLQKVNDADDRFLFTPLVLVVPEGATEQFSSRLRATIVALLGGGVLVFGAASLGRYRELAGDHRTPGAEPTARGARIRSTGPRSPRPGPAVARWGTNRGRPEPAPERDPSGEQPSRAPGRAGRSRAPGDPEPVGSSPDRGR